MNTKNYLPIKLHKQLIDKSLMILLLGVNKLPSHTSKEVKIFHKYDHWSLGKKLIAFKFGKQRLKSKDSDSTSSSSMAHKEKGKHEQMGKTNLQHHICRLIVANEAL